MSRFRSESTNSSPAMQEDMSQISTLTQISEQGRRLSETRSTRIDEKDLMRNVSSKIHYFVRDGLLSNEQGMIAARHFDAKHFEIEVNMWLRFEDAKKVDYIKTLCSKDVQKLLLNQVLTRGCQGCSSIKDH